jgi:hypothetical protein
MVREGGIVITHNSETAYRALEKAGFDVIDAGSHILLALNPPKHAFLEGRDVLIMVCITSVSPSITTDACQRKLVCTLGES